jgi:hypothetical protein
MNSCTALFHDHAGACASSAPLSHRFTSSPISTRCEMPRGGILAVPDFSRKLRRAAPAEQNAMGCPRRGRRDA